MKGDRTACLKYREKERNWEQTNPRIFNMVLGQCTREMKSKLGGREGWPVIIEAQDRLTLLKMIHRLSSQQDRGSLGLMETITLEQSLPLNLKE